MKESKRYKYIAEELSGCIDPVHLPINFERGDIGDKLGGRVNIEMEHSRQRRAQCPICGRWVIGGQFNTHRCFRRAQQELFYKADRIKFNLVG